MMAQCHTYAQTASHKVTVEYEDGKPKCVKTVVIAAQNNGSVEDSVLKSKSSTSYQKSHPSQHARSRHKLCH